MAKKAKPQETETKPDATPAKLPKCGIIMPISEMPGYSSAHWFRVMNILKQAISKTDHCGEMVSDEDETRLIQETIMNNLWDCPIIVCDVSGKNANVMLELGIRLTFDKPVVIVKDDATAYTFDIGNIRHIGYPKDLNYPGIVRFKKELAKAIKATIKAAEVDDYSPFLTRYKRIKPSKLENAEVPASEYLNLQIQTLANLVSEMKSTTYSQIRKDINAAASVSLKINPQLLAIFNLVTQDWNSGDVISDEDIKEAIQTSIDFLKDEHPDSKISNYYVTKKFHEYIHGLGYIPAFS